MNYQTIYESLIHKRKLNPAEGCVEKHHIIPKSMGGGDEDENLVTLTAREHYIAHLLLAKMHANTVKFHPMLYALWMMQCSPERLDRPQIKNSRMYGWIREEFVKFQTEAQSGEKNNMFGRKWIHNPETTKNSTIPKNEPIPDGWVAGKKQKKEINPRKKYKHKRGYIMSDQGKENIRQAALKRVKKSK